MLQKQVALIVVEEASRSQSECEIEDSTVSPTPGVMRHDEQQSDEGTDVEDTETSRSNIAHAGDGDKADGTLFMTYHNELLTGNPSYRWQPYWSLPNPA